LRTAIKAHKITTASLTAIGVFENATVGWIDDGTPPGV
jgi:predicted DNA-binding protein with PD1-like motif